jgi:hypothetical protein
MAWLFPFGDFDVSSRVDVRQQLIEAPGRALEGLALSLGGILQHPIEAARGSLELFEFPSADRPLGCRFVGAHQIHDSFPQGAVRLSAVFVSHGVKQPNNRWRFEIGNFKSGQTASSSSAIVTCNLESDRRRWQTKITMRAKKPRFAGTKPPKMGHSAC